MVKSPDPEAKLPRSEVRPGSSDSLLMHLLTTWVTLGKLLNYSVPSFLSCKMGIIIKMKLLSGLIFVNYLGQNLDNMAKPHFYKKYKN